MRIEFSKPNWNNNEYIFDVFPNLTVAVVSDVLWAISLGWLFWRINLSSERSWPWMQGVEFVASLLPYLTVTRISHHTASVSIGWLSWGITLFNKP